MFDENAEGRIADCVRDYERTPRFPIRGSTPPRIIQPMRVAKTTSTITARSGTKKGSGTVTTYVDDRSGTGTDKVLQTGVKVFNPYSQSIASGTWVILGVIDGVFQILGADCP